MSKRRDEMAAVVGDDDPCPSGAGDFGDVHVVDPAAGHTVFREKPQHRLPIDRRKIVDAHPPEHLSFEKADGIVGGQSKLRRKPRRDGEEFQAAVPRGARRRCRLLGDGVRQGLRRRALWPRSISPASSTLVSKNTVTAIDSVSALQAVRDGTSNAYQPIRATGSP